jgi:hypothetical protein
VQRGPAVRREAGEELGQLARDHGARVRPGQVGSEGGAHPLVQREGLPVCIEPARLGNRVLGQEANQVAGGALRAQVARAAVAELMRRDLDERGACSQRHLARAVA